MTTIDKIKTLNMPFILWGHFYSRFHKMGVQMITAIQKDTNLNLRGV